MTSPFTPSELPKTEYPTGILEGDSAAACRPVLMGDVGTVLHSLSTAEQYRRDLDAVEGAPCFFHAMAAVHARRSEAERGLA